MKKKHLMLLSFAAATACTAHAQSNMARQMNAGELVFTCTPQQSIGFKKKDGQVSSPTSFNPSSRYFVYQNRNRREFMLIEVDNKTGKETFHGTTPVDTNIWKRFTGLKTFDFLVNEETLRFSVVDNSGFVGDEPKDIFMEIGSCRI